MLVLVFFVLVLLLSPFCTACCSCLCVVLVRRSVLVLPFEALCIVVWLVFVLCLGFVSLDEEALIQGFLTNHTIGSP